MLQNAGQIWLRLLCHLIGGSVISTLANASESDGVILECTGYKDVTIHGETTKIPIEFQAIVAINILGKSACQKWKGKNYETGESREFPESCSKLLVSEDAFTVLTEKRSDQGDHVAYNSNILIDRFTGSLSWKVEQHFFGGSYIRTYTTQMHCKKTSEFSSKKQF